MHQDARLFGFAIYRGRGYGVGRLLEVLTAGYVWLNVASRIRTSEKTSTSTSLGE